MPHVTRIVASMAAAVHQSTTRVDSSQKKGGRKRNEINIIYANPLPITFSRTENRFAVTALGIFGISPTQVLNPRCAGTFDPITRSVWITNPRDTMILWRRGFFGKGNLSRSEPSWLVRQSQLRAATSGRRKPNYYVYLYRLLVLMETLY
jgi:tRNA-splicing endonuclease subunit Sen2